LGKTCGRAFLRMRHGMSRGVSEKKSFPKRGEVYWVALDPTIGKEIKKTRPALVVSPDEMNAVLRTVVMAPVTSTIRNYPTRCTIRLAGKQASVALDQVRTVSFERLRGKITKIDASPALAILREMFAD
jgi:mRNA interferase MazF